MAQTGNKRRLYKRLTKGTSCCVAANVPQALRERANQMLEKLNTGPYRATMSALLESALRHELARLESELDASIVKQELQMHPALEVDQGRMVRRPPTLSN